MGLSIEQQREKIRAKRKLDNQPLKVKSKEEKAEIFLNKLTNKYKRKLENEATKQERILKKALSELEIEFVFQKVFRVNQKFYICDFYLPELNLVVELDGIQHSTKKGRRKDKTRTKWLKANFDIKVIRFKNSEIKNIKSFEKVIEYVDYILTYNRS